MSQGKYKAAIMRGNKVYTARADNWVSAIKKLQSLLEKQDGITSNDNDYTFADGAKHAHVGRIKAIAE